MFISASRSRLLLQYIRLNGLLTNMLNQQYLYKPSNLGNLFRGLGEVMLSNLYRYVQKSICMSLKFLVSRIKTKKLEQLSNWKVCCISYRCKRRHRGMSDSSQYHGSGHYSSYVFFVSPFPSSLHPPPPPSVASSHLRAVCTRLLQYKNSVFSPVLGQIASCVVTVFPAVH